MRLRSDDAEDVSPTVPDAMEAAEPIRRLFVTIVIYLNLGILAVSLGAMLIAFRGELRNGGILIGAGVIVLVRAWQQYRRRHEVFEKAS